MGEEQCLGGFWEVMVSFLLICWEEIVELILSFIIQSENEMFLNQIGWTKFFLKDFYSYRDMRRRWGRGILKIFLIYFKSVVDQLEQLVVRIVLIVEI